jgi:hypothetical protein
MALSCEEDRAKRFLEFLGLKVTRILEDSEHRVCDFAATDDHQTYLIEVKAKEEDLSFLDELDAKGEATQEVPLRRSNPISGIIKKALGQLNASENPKESFKVIWFSLYNTFDENVTQKQLRSTLYGIQDITTFKAGDQFSVTECYYFTYTDFHRFPDLDGVIVEMSSGAKLWPNPFSNRSDEFLQSKLYQTFKNENAVHNPIELEKNGGCFIPDFNIDRKDQAALLEHLKSKYNLHNARRFPFIQARGHVMVPRSDIEENHGS